MCSGGKATKWKCGHLTIYFSKRCSQNPLPPLDIVTETDGYLQFLHKRLTMVISTSLDQHSDGPGFCAKIAMNSTMAENLDHLCMYCEAVLLTDQMKPLMGGSEMAAVAPPLRRSSRQRSLSRGRPSKQPASAASYLDANEKIASEIIASGSMARPQVRQYMEYQMDASLTSIAPNNRTYLPAAPTPPDLLEDLPEPATSMSIYRPPQSKSYRPSKPHPTFLPDQMPQQRYQSDMQAPAALRLPGNQLELAKMDLGIAASCAERLTAAAISAPTDHMRRVLEELRGKIQNDISNSHKKYIALLEEDSKIKSCLETALMLLKEREI